MFPRTGINDAEFGVGNYKSATLNAGTVSLTGVGRCVGIRVFAAGTDGTFNVNGGDTITVRNGAGVDAPIQGTLFAPVVNWLSGTLDVVIWGVS